MDTETLKRLQKENDDAERRHRSATRRVEWMEKRLAAAETPEQFDVRNAELEAAIDDCRRYGKFAAFARYALTHAEMEMRGEQ